MATPTGRYARLGGAATVLAMQVAVVVLAVIAVIAAILWLSALRRLRSLTSEHDSTLGHLTATRTELADNRRTHDEAVRGYEAEATASTRKLEETASDLGDARNRVAEIEVELASANETIRANEVALDASDKERDDAVARADDLHDQVVALIDDRDALREEMDRVKEQPALVLGEPAANGSDDITTLWQLELARSERTWAHSVAVNPETDASPFETSTDPVRTAVEIEASALREEVGAFITIDWQAEPIDDPSRRQLLLRVAQEILASASREPAPSTLRVTGDADVTIELFATDDDDTTMNVIVPAIDHDLVDVTSAHGLSITVKAS